MSDELQDAVDEAMNIDLGELTPEQLGITNEPSSGITAFIIVKKPSGDWYATADLKTNIMVDRQATMDDMKHGCQDVVDSMFQTSIAYQVTEMVTAALKAQNQDQPQPLRHPVSQGILYLQIKGCRMAFIEMTCTCMASFQADVTESETLVLMWAQSFVSAHLQCGYMNKVVSDKPDQEWA